MSVASKLGVFLSRFVLPVFILAIGVGYFVSTRDTEAEGGGRARDREIRTRVTELDVQNYPVLVSVQGTVQSHSEITLSSQVSGQIVAISPNFEVGAHFSRGEILVQLDSRDYEHAVKILEARIKSATAELEIAESQLAGSQRLHEREFLTDTELDRDVASQMRAEATLSTLITELDQAKLELDRTAIRAPFDGRVRERHVGIGQSVGSSSALAVIFAVDFAEVRLPISAQDLRYLTLPETASAPPVPVTLTNAIHPDPDTAWEAQIVRTEGPLHDGSLDLIAIARIEDPFGLQTGHPPLRIGQPVTGRISGKELQDVVSIPRAAVRELNQVILVDKSDLRLTKFAIEELWSDDEYIIARDNGQYESMYLATTHIVYAPEGAEVEIIPEISDAPEPDVIWEDSGS